MSARRDSQEPVALLTPEERDQEVKPEPTDLEAEAGRVEMPKDKNLDHEYTVPSTVKYAWLGTYFFFSLLLTLYNKLVLGMVSPLLFDMDALRGTAAAAAACQECFGHATASIPMPIARQQLCRQHVSGSASDCD